MQARLIVGLAVYLALWASLPADSPGPAGVGGPSSGNYVDLIDTDVRPAVVSQARPVYPPELRQRGINGQALVDFIVDLDGSTTRIQVLRTNDRAFGEAARDSVAKWRFSPGRKNGRLVRVHIQVPVVFTVNNDSNNGGDTRNEPDLGPGETVVDVSKVTVQPVAVFQVRPIYPASLRARNISGRTLIYFIVKKNGGVSNVRAVSATDPLFGMAGVAAVRKWRFHPARQEDHPVNCQLEVPLVFSVNP